MICGIGLLQMLEKYSDKLKTMGRLADSTS